MRHADGCVVSRMAALFTWFLLALIYLTWLSRCFIFRVLREELLWTYSDNKYLENFLYKDILKFVYDFGLGLIERWHSPIIACRHDQ